MRSFRGRPLPPTDTQQTPPCRSSGVQLPEDTTICRLTPVLSVLPPGELPRWREKERRRERGPTGEPVGSSAPRSTPMQGWRQPRA
jgi:hypothetical protein